MNVNMQLIDEGIHALTQSDPDGNSLNYPCSLAILLR